MHAMLNEIRRGINLLEQIEQIIHAQGVSTDRENVEYHRGGGFTVVHSAQHGNIRLEWHISNDEPDMSAVAVKIVIEPPGRRTGQWQHFNLTLDLDAKIPDAWFRDTEGDLGRVWGPDIEGPLSDSQAMEIIRDMANWFVQHTKGTTDALRAPSQLLRP